MKTAIAISRVDVMFRAFSDRTRLRILNLLRGGETCVCDLQATLGVPQAKVSRHLAYLRRAGLVTVRKQGLWSYYTLAPARDAFHRRLLDCLACCLTDVPELARDAKKIRRSEMRCAGSSECCDSV